jgi:hypothetical protein
MSARKIYKQPVSMQNDAQYPTGEMQIKTAVKYHFVPARVALIRKTDVY